MLNSDKNEVLTLFKSEELAGILECLKKHKLTKRFGRLFTLLNRVATDFFDLSPITGKFSKEWSEVIYSQRNTGILGY